MAIKQDGTQSFGIAVASFAGLVVSNYTITETGERVDLNDGDGLPLGSVTIPGRKEWSATLQYGASGPVPTVGSEFTYGSSAHIITEAGDEQSQAEYRMVSASGYIKIN